MTKEELLSLESGARQHQDEILYQEKLGNECDESLYRKFNALDGKLSIDGNQYCALVGEDLQAGMAGFGDTAYKAIENWNENMHKPLPERK